MRYAIHHGDVTEIAADLSGFDAVFCDPPYGLDFMGARWDYDVPSVELWQAVQSACKPGALMLAFGGSRTYHRLACRIEDAGWELRDCLLWLYGSGFPKSYNISKGIDKQAGAEREVVGEMAAPRGTDDCLTMGGGWQAAPQITAPATEAAALWAGHGTALKPAHEPICLAQAPRDGGFARNAVDHWCGGLDVDGARLAIDAPITENAQGRWPANVLLDESAAQALDAQSGELTSGSRAAGVRRGLGYMSRASGDGGPAIEASTGGASRFFYCAKATRAEREAGLQASEGRANTHPTVKPLDLCRYLASLLLPPPHPEGLPRRILVPFSGSGSEMIGAARAGWEEVVGIELQEKYVRLATARLSHWTSCTPDVHSDDIEQAEADVLQSSLLDLLGGSGGEER